MPAVVQRFESMQYDGTNGAEVIDWLCGSVDLISDDGTALVVDFIGSPRTIAAGGWVVAAGGGTGVRAFYTEVTAADYANVWLEVPHPTT